MPLGNSLAHSLAHRLGNSLSGGGVATPVLDAFTTVPRAAYSDWRRLLSSYTGPLNRIRKTSGGDTTTEHDVPYVAASNLLDSADQATFVGSESWAVVTRRDQTAGARNVTNATAAQQPVGGTSGTASKILTRDAANFVRASSHRLRRTDSLGLSGATALTVFVEVLPASVPANSYIVSLGTGTTNQMFALAFIGSATTLWVGCVSASRTFTIADATAQATNKFLVVFGAGAQWGTISLYQNGVACSELSSLNPATTLNLANTTFGHCCQPSAADQMNGKMSEVIVWNAELTGAELTAALAL